MRAQLFAGLRMLLVMTVLVGVAYPLAVTGAAQLWFHGEANGSLVARDGRVVGSRAIGQVFEGPEWFHPRPSSAGDGYDASASGPSNLGPTNPELLASIEARVARYRREEPGLPRGAPVPVDAVTASASGLDPHISIANARIQAVRVASARALDLDAVLLLVDAHTMGRKLGVLGEPGVNVLMLNLSVADLADRQT